MDKIKNKNKIIMTTIGILLIIVLIGGITFAFLSDFFTQNDDATVGTVSAELYQNTTLISGYWDDQSEQYITINSPIVTLGAINTPTNVNFNVKNSGTINILVRVFVTIGYRATENPTTLNPLTSTDISVGSLGFINDYTELGTDIHSYFAYYNAVLTPNSTATFISSITPLIAFYANKDVELVLRADAIAYSGNYYYLDDQGQTLDPADDPWLVSSTFLQSWTAWQ